LVQIHCRVGSAAWLHDYTHIDITTRYIIVVTAKNKVDQIININVNIIIINYFIICFTLDPFPDLAKDYDGALWSVSIATTKASW
jgi:hypothetical protein